MRLGMTAALSSGITYANSASRERRRSSTDVSTACMSDRFSHSNHRPRSLRRQPVLSAQIAMSRSSSSNHTVNGLPERSRGHLRAPPVHRLTAGVGLPERVVVPVRRYALVLREQTLQHGP